MNLKLGFEFAQNPVFLYNTLMTAKRILIVDDALELGRLLKATLNTLNKNLDVVVAASVDEVFLEADKGGVDLLITDFRLPGLAGIEMIKKIRIKQPNIKVILITALSDDHLPQDVKNLQVNFTLKKPMEIEEFLQAAKKCLGLEKGDKLSQSDSRDRMAGHVRKTLEWLRSDLEALVVCLIDENGNVAVKVGEYPEKKFETRWVPSILSSVASDAKLLHLFTTPSGDGIHAYMGPSFHLIFMTADENILLVLIKPDHGNSHLLTAIGAVIETQRELLLILSGKMPVRAERESVPEIKAREKESTQKDSDDIEPQEKKTEALELSEFETRLQQSRADIAASELDQFWETVEEAEHSPEGSGIPYEQAEKMGLVKKAGKEKTD